MNLFDSIQQIPGNTSNEKQAWIAVEIKSKVTAGLSLNEIVESDKFPNSLKPLIKIESAKILIRMGQKDFKNFEAITEGLRSEDIELVNRSLSLKEFFNGLNEVLNVKYFMENLFPFVAYNTRGKVIKKLGRCLQNSGIAEEFFEALRCSYGQNVALPLLMACSEVFVKKAIIEHRLVLTEQMINDLYEKFPELAIWYLGLSDPKLNDPTKRFNLYIDLRHYTGFLGKLFKTHLAEFIEIYEKNADNGLELQLTNRQSKFFAKHAKKYYLENPKAFYKMLKSESVYYKEMEIMFPKMLPEKKKHFFTNPMLGYLAHYPKTMTSTLLLQTYKSNYGIDLLDDEKNVTEELIRFLPTEQRVQQARIKIQKEIDKNGHDRSEWKCYLTTGEVLPKLYEMLLKTPDTTERTRLIAQMLRCCEVNEDLDALYELFVHVRDKHRNEVPLFQHAFIHNVTRLLDTLSLTTKYWIVLLEIAQRMFVKADVSDFRRMSLEFLKAALNFKLENDEPADSVFEMIHFVLTSGYNWQQWDFFPYHLEYQRFTISRLNSLTKECLETEKWDQIRVISVTNLLRSMYAFNEKAKYEKVDLLPKNDFQWVFDELKKIVQDNSNHYYLFDLKALMKKRDIESFYKFWPTISTHSIDIKSLNLLKNDPKLILQNWEEYFEKCEREYKSLTVKAFLKELRWHQEIREKFIDQCIANIKKHKNGRLLVLLALLTDGKSFGEFVEPLLPTETKIEITGSDAKERFSFFNHIAPAMKRSNPPVALELIEKLCEGDYLASALSALANICRRTELKKAIEFAKHLSNQRVSVAKHGVRLMSLLENSTEISKFLSSLWKQQEHYSIRTAIFAEAQLLFERNENPETWSLIKMIISEISEKEILLLNPWPFNLKEMSDEHVIECLQLLFNTVDRLEKSGDRRAESYACRLFESIEIPICNILPEEFLAELLRKYLFDQMRGESAKRFLVSVYFQNFGILEIRLSIFSSIFTETVKNEWNSNLNSNLTKAKNYPIRSTVRSLITGIVYSKMSSELRSPVIGHVFQAFQSVLTAFDDAKSYLLLNFASEWSQAATINEFSERLAKKLIDLFSLYTPWFNSSIAETLQDFLTLADFGDFKNDDVIFKVINNLIEFDSIEVLHTVAQLLKLFNYQFDDGYQWTIERLMKNDHPAVKALLNSFHLNE